MAGGGGGGESGGGGAPAAGSSAPAAAAAAAAAAVAAAAAGGEGDSPEEATALEQLVVELSAPDAETRAAAADALLDVPTPGAEPNSEPGERGAPWWGGAG